MGPIWGFRDQDEEGRKGDHEGVVNSDAAPDIDTHFPFLRLISSLAFSVSEIGIAQFVLEHPDDVRMEPCLSAADGACITP